MLLRTQEGRFGNKVLTTAASLIIPSLDLVVPKHKNVLMVLTPEDGKPMLMGASNIITNAGDIYYAERGAAETPTNNFNSLYLSTTAWSPAVSKTTTASDLANVIAGSEKTVDATYPQTNDGDSDNTGAGTDVVTWRFSYAQGDFNATGIVSVAITTAGQTWGSGGGLLLTALTVASFDKTASDTLKVFVNHTANGV